MGKESRNVPGVRNDEVLDTRAVDAKQAPLSVGKEKEICCKCKECKCKKALSEKPLP